jgi:cytochrome c
LEYGQKWNARNMDARLSSISYIAGNRTPIAKINSDVVVGATPLAVQFSASESKDYDDDQLTYEWFFNSDEIQSTEANPSYTFTEDGVYNVRLKVKDEEGKYAESNTRILVGNDPPELTIRIDPNSKIYWDRRELNYEINVSDKQDGNTTAGTIDPKRVKVTLDYIPEGKDIVKATIGHQQNVVPKGQKLIDASDCKACHAINEKVNGPSYRMIADKYTDKDRAVLINRVIKGSSGIWGETMMAAHPQLSIDEVGEIVDYILLLKQDDNEVLESLPLTGVLKFDDHLSYKEHGVYVLMASYRDEGNEAYPESMLSVRQQVIFTTPKFELEDADEISEGISTWSTGGKELLGSVVDGSYVIFEDMNLEGLKAIQFSAHYNSDYPYEGRVEVREGSPTGKLIGSTAVQYYNKKKGASLQNDIKVQPTTSDSPLCLVFKNEKDKEKYICNANWIWLQYN